MMTGLDGCAVGRWRGSLPLLAAGLIAAAAPAAAEGTASGLPPLPGLPGAVPNGLALTGSIETLYDSNVLRFARAVGPQAHRDDFRYSPAGSFTYGRSGGLLTLSVNGLIGHDFFQYNRYLDRNRYVGGGALTYRGGTSCQVTVTGNYTSRQNGIREAGAAIDPTNPVDDVGVVIDNVQTSTLYGANAGCGSPTGRLSFGGGYTHSELSNGAVTRRFADSNSDSFNGNIGLGILRPGQLSLVGSYTTIGYPGRFVGAPGFVVPPQLLNRGVKTYRIGVSFSRPIGTRLSGSIGASFLHADPGGVQQPYSSPAYNIGLNYVAGPRLTFSLTGSRDIIASTTAGALFRVVDQIQLVSHYSLGEAISIDANAGFINNNYKQSFAVPGDVARISEATKQFGLSLTYAPRSLYDVTVNVNQTIRNGNPSILNYNSTRAGVTLAVHI